MMRQYLDSNPNIDNDRLGVLLMVDELYKDLPKDLGLFRQRFPHFDPKTIERGASGVLFSKIARSKEPTSVIMHRLNSYFNMKANYIDNYKSYDKNMKHFAEASNVVSKFIDDLLEASNYPADIVDLFSETDKVKGCNDLLELLQLYKKSNKRRIKYEVLRKIGLIVLLIRIRRAFAIDDIDFSLDKVKKLFKKGLGFSKGKPREYYLWLGADDKVEFSDDKESSVKKYERAIHKRKKLGLNFYPLQTFLCYPVNTKFGGEILHMEARNKFRRNGEVYYSSFMEKFLRKNLEFPNQVRDALGIKLVVSDDERIPQLITDLETFIGGSSTRKQEKNALNRFGKKKLSKYSSEKYFVWKAIYDLTLPHPSIYHLQKLIPISKGNKVVEKALRTRINYFMKRPKDFVVEVQLQSIHSYLLSIAKGSPTDHDVLKMNQIRSNTFYKLFPKEIYSAELLKLKKRLLNSR